MSAEASTPERHWLFVEYLHEVVKNPNIHLRGRHSYYSKGSTEGFEASVVRYLHGDDFSREVWTPAKEIDQLHIGDYVCIGTEAAILMGGNHAHRPDWFSLYPHADMLDAAYQPRGDTVIGDGALIGSRATILPGATLGEGAMVGAGAVVGGDVEPYAIVSGNPAVLSRHRFPPATVKTLLSLQIYRWPDAKSEALRPLLCAADVEALVKASKGYDEGQ